jgi:hypothetical protein
MRIPVLSLRPYFEIQSGFQSHNTNQQNPPLYNLNEEHFVGLYNMVILQCKVQKAQVSIIV